MAKKQYITFRIDNLKSQAANRLGLHRDFEGARMLHRLIENYVTWEEVQAEAADINRLAKEKGLI